MYLQCPNNHQEVENNHHELAKGISGLKYDFGKSEVEKWLATNISVLNTEVASDSPELLEESQHKAIMTENKIISKNEKKQNENKEINENKISILQNIQIKPERQKGEKNSETYLHVRTASQRLKTHQQGFADTYDSDEIEEPFQSSGSEYLPSDEEGNQLPFIFDPLITDIESIKSKKIPKKYNKVQDKKLDQNGRMPRKECNPNYDCNEIPVDAVASLKDVKQNRKTRSQNKKTTCSYCLNDATHFPRHLIRNHSDEGAVKELLSFPPNHIERKTLLAVIRRQGIFVCSLSTNNIRPVRRPKETESLNDPYVSCPGCMGFFRRNYLRRHRKQCSLRTECNTKARENHLSLAQVVTVCSGAHSDFLSSLRLKQEVFPIMRNDNI
ncbi:hypothetical protein HUJ04_005430 [Dendroctonus ponderosae]|nr:hypothetical protein HUJ04_005430 [Dendroctonus ponderosae]